MAIAPEQILLVGLGDSGAQALLSLAEQYPEHPRILLINTDSGRAVNAANVQTVVVGVKSLKGAGAGGDPRLGQRAVEMELPELRPLWQNARLVLLVTGLGGGTGTGAAPVVMAECRKAGALTMALVTLPFELEGRQRAERALQGLLALQEAADCVVCLPNQALAGAGDADIKLDRLFQCANEFVANCLQTLWLLLTRRGVINVGFADLCAVVRAGHGRCRMAYVETPLSAGAAAAADALRKHPLLENGGVLESTPALLAAVIGGPDLALRDVKILLERLLPAADTALQMTGVICEPNWQDRLRLLVLAAEHQPVGAGDFSGRSAASDAAAPDENVAAARKNVQLSLFPQTGNRFDGVEPTIMNSENLDRPTFLRRGLTIGRLRRGG